MKQGELYKVTGLDFYGELVIYIREDRYANQHWVMLPSGDQVSIWSGYLYPVETKRT